MRTWTPIVVLGVIYVVAICVGITLTLRGNGTLGPLMAIGSVIPMLLTGKRLAALPRSDD